ncbi:unnamed protein product [Rotaria sp. Silwood2]|nr:unnamed protein product [Rotaria sp. Silwood2]CAF2708589.1 unnamed protein product [Rotaria sp. Silwood2]CAF2971061.1 unnamed protein product [Rotaria sp. Silwood2]CAF3118676.1 unnamed protein product [Rotaria sp. Silwood2]CAF3855849.1 unnamed protein product [Rotaria sp. Silwood2]
MGSRHLDKLSSGLALNNKFLPVHCVVTRDECPQRVLQDGFVIIPAHTKFHDIVPVVLRSMEADVGKIEQDERIDGEILIKNWNPLSIDKVTDDRTVSVQDILGDLMNIAILQIRISSKYSNSSQDKRSNHLFRQSVSLISDDRDKNDCEYDDQHSPNGYSSNSNTTDGDNTPLNLSKKPCSSSLKSNIHYPNTFASLLSLTQQQYDSPSTNRRQRERTTFDPHEETPRLLQIFTDTKHPTRYQIASICETLNALPCRKGKKALEPYNIQYWFKNARAALKRKKRRFIPSEIATIQEYTTKCELDSSDEIDDDDVDDTMDDTDDNNQKQQNHHNNYYFNYLQAFDISLTDQQKQKLTHSDESNDDDNGSLISNEQSPSTQTSLNSTKLTTFDYNRSRRNRIFIDPTTEVPKLEQWFAIETHPDHLLIERICSELNEGEYRTKFPKLETKHIRLWFKNHRAKVKRICRIQTPNDDKTTTAVAIKTETTEK